MSMITHTAVVLLSITTCLIRVRCIALERDDYYYGAVAPEERPVGYLNDAPTMKKEDEAALNIYNLFISDSQKNGCTYLEDFVKAYADDTTTWTDDDKTNKEYNIDGTLNEANQDLQSIRSGLKNALGDTSSTKEKKCDNLFHLITCDFGGIRQVSPFEFTFKKGPWIAGNLKKSTDSESEAGSAYLQVKFGKNWRTDMKEQLMFQDGKGRDGAYSKFIATCGMEGGISPSATTIKGLDSFFGKGFHDSNPARFVTTSECRKKGLTPDSLTPTKGTCSQNATEMTHNEHDFCKIFIGSCKFAFERKNGNAKKEIINVLDKLGEKGHPHCPAKTFLVRDKKKSQSIQMQACGVPYVGGVSGSILEQLAFFVYKNKKESLTDKLILVLMSVLNLSGHHSLGEAFATTGEFLKILKFVGNVTDIPLPISLAKGCSDGLHENQFLEGLATATSAVFK